MDGHSPSSPNQRILTGAPPSLSGFLSDGNLRIVCTLKYILFLIVC